jgi:hypothetical protein
LQYTQKMLLLQSKIDKLEQDKHGILQDYLSIQPMIEDLKQKQRLYFKHTKKSLKVLDTAPLTSTSIANVSSNASIPSAPTLCNDFTIQARIASDSGRNNALGSDEYLQGAHPAKSSASFNSANADATGVSRHLNQDSHQLQNLSHSSCKFPLSSCKCFMKSSTNISVVSQNGVGAASSAVGDTTIHVDVCRNKESSLRSRSLNTSYGKGKEPNQMNNAWDENFDEDLCTYRMDNDPESGMQNEEAGDHQRQFLQDDIRRRMLKAEQEARRIIDASRKQSTLYITSSWRPTSYAIHSHE